MIITRCGERYAIATVAGVIAYDGVIARFAKVYAIITVIYGVVIFDGIPCYGVA